MKSIRISEALFEAAELEAAAMSRSAAGQLEHWARLGRAAEEAGINVNEIRDLLVYRDPVLRSFKDEAQARDCDDVMSGRKTNESMVAFGQNIDKRTKVDYNLDGEY